MKANRFLEKLTENLPVKIICLVISMFLYLFYNLSLIDKKNIVIPLNVIQDGAVINVNNNIPESVRVVVRADSSKSNLITEEGIHASIDLSTLTENGVYDIPIFISVDNSLLEIDPFELQVFPEYISVNVERKVKKAVRLETPVVGEVAHGYKISETIVNPSVVYVTGPESVVQGTKTVLTDTIDVEDISSNKSYNVHLYKMNKLLSYEESEQYEVQVKLEAIEITKDILNVKIYPAHLSESFMLLEPLDTVKLSISGKMTVVEKYQVDENTLTVDCSSVTSEGEYELPVIIRIPGNITLVEKPVDKVTVKVGKVLEQ